jgi:WD40 repeat protein
MWTFPFHEGKGVTCSSFSPDDSLLLCGSGRLLHVVERGTGRSILHLRHRSDVSCCAWVPGGNWVVCGTLGNEPELCIWDARQGHRICTMHAHTATITCCHVSPNGKVTTSSNDGSILVWSASGQLELALRGKDISHHIRGGAGITCSVSPDGSLLLSGGDDKSIRFWNAVTGALKCTRRHHSEAVAVCMFSCDGKRAMSCSMHEMALWDASSFRLLGSWRTSDTGTSCCSFSPCGRMLVSGSWSLGTWAAGENLCLWVC